MKKTITFLGLAVAAIMFTNSSFAQSSNRDGNKNDKKEKKYDTRDNHLGRRNAHFLGGKPDKFNDKKFDKKRDRCDKKNNRNHGKRDRRK